MPLLELKSVTKRFAGHEAVDSVSLGVDTGEAIVIIGPSGCGKSTLLRCINGLEHPDSGDIFFQGVNLTEKNTDWRQIRQQIGMVFQCYDLFPHMTVLENLLLAPVKVQKRNRGEAEVYARSLLERFGLGNREADYPHQLSGGQKQRIAIVRALCMKPIMMLFDEVTASIDPEMVYEVLQVIRELKQSGMTMLIVTHEMTFARKVADEVIFMDGGHVIETGAPEDFFTKPKSERAAQFLEKFLL